jgi:hypothetical protein
LVTGDRFLSQVGRSSKNRVFSKIKVLVLENLTTPFNVLGALGDAGTVLNHPITVRCPNGVNGDTSEACDRRYVVQVA